MRPPGGGDAVYQGKFLVPRCKRPRQAAGVHVVPRRIRHLQRHLHRGRRRRLQGLQSHQGAVMSGLLDKVVIVTGAGRGTGRTHCERFADEGADVIAIDIPPATIDLGVTAAEVKKRGRRCVTGLADVRDLGALTSAVDAGVAELGRLDVIVANAGIHTAGAPTWELTEDAWQHTVDVNLTGVWQTVKAAVGHLGDEGGSIVIISSTPGYAERRTRPTPRRASMRWWGWPARWPTSSVRAGSGLTPCIPAPWVRRWCSMRRRSNGCGRICWIRRLRMRPRSCEPATCSQCRGWTLSMSPTRWFSWPLTKPVTSRGLSSSSMPA